MARIARVVVPRTPHHVTQRGNRNQPTFFNQDDYQAYIALMAHWCAHHAVVVLAYCLMPNHAHLIMVPPSEDALRRAIGEAHRRYTRAVNLREGWKGHLWQGRFSSFPMDERYLLAAARYVEFNPVRAQLVERPQDYPWSSARAHLNGRDDALVKVAPLLDLVNDWKSFISTGIPEADMVSIRRHERTGRPLGSNGFIARVEREVDRILRRQKPGPKDNNQRNQDRLN